jgi:transposase InsO family protein
MRRLDELHLEHLVCGSRRLTALLRREGREVNRKRVVRLLQLMGVEAGYPKRSLSQPAEGHRIYPYLLEGLEISGPDQVWCSDITYVPMAYGFMYLVSVMDWWSRYVVGWELSNSLDSEFCILAVLPLNLMPIYPRWRIDAANVWSYVPGLLVVGAFLLCWRYRRSWGRAWLVCLAACRT